MPSPEFPLPVSNVSETAGVPSDRALYATHRGRKSQTVEYKDPEWPTDESGLIKVIPN